MNKLIKIVVGSCAALLFLLFSNYAVAASNSLVIDEIKISGESSTDEYVIIKNVSSLATNLKGYTIAKRTSSTSATVDFVNLAVFDNKEIQPGERLMIAHLNFSGEVGPNSQRYTTSNSITPSNTVVIRTPTKEFVDLLGFGNALISEGQPLPEIAANEIYQRVGDDTDNNINDFELLVEKIDYDLNLTRILISEVYPAPESGQQEWFEIYNPTNFTIKLFGLKICDGAGSMRCFAFSKTDEIKPFSFNTYEQKTTKITLNNSGDWLELYDFDENLIQATDNFGSSTSEESFSLFGSNWEWSITPTRNFQNILTLLPDEPPKKKKTTTKKAKTKKAVLASEDIEQENEPVLNEEEDVKGEQIARNLIDKEKGKINSKTFGYMIIGLAIAIFCGYILYEKREKIFEIYHKFRSKND